jgi:hypothetical protein
MAEEITMATADVPIGEPATGGASDDERRSGRVATFARMAGIAKRDRRIRYWTLDRILAFLALLMLPAGLGAIILGWLGAANTPFLFEQVPYMISGGLLGMGLMLMGGLLYVGSWLARLAEQSRDEADKVRELIDVLRADLAATPGRAVDAVARREAGLPALLVATPTGTMFHRPDCSVVSNRDDLHEVDPEAETNMSPCKICEPL